MKKTLKKNGVILLFVFIGIQFIPTIRNVSNEVYRTDFIQTFNPPEHISNLLKNSCYDCHSNNTNYPWYNKIQPISWFLERHINEAKDELNFSEFDAYSNRKKKGKLKSIISQIKDDKMPLSSYTLIHRDAKFSEKDKSELQKWLTELREAL